jgi:hypothetical protein
MSAGIYQPPILIAEFTLIACDEIYADPGILDRERQYGGPDGEGGLRMARSVRWSLVVLAVAAAYVLAVWLAASVRVPFGPTMEADRWVVDAGFATAISAAVLTWAGWWMDRSERSKNASKSTESAGRRDVFHNEHNRYHGPTHTGSGSQYNTPPKEEEAS